MDKREGRHLEDFHYNASVLRLFTQNFIYIEQTALFGFVQSCRTRTTVLEPLGYQKIIIHHHRQGPIITSGQRRRDEN